MKELTNIQLEELNKALFEAFDEDSLEQMLRFRLGKRLSSIAPSNKNLPTAIFKLIDRAEREGWIPQLIIAARESNPGNSSLLEFAQQFAGLTPMTAPELGLEKIIRATNSFLDVSKWRTHLGKIEAQVCRIEIHSSHFTGYGTGFLLGPDVIMTNYHVMREVIEGKGAMPDEVIFRFDYKRLTDGTTLNRGTEHRLAAKDWLIDKSPPSPVDDIPGPKDTVPEPDQLDYALLRVAEPLGNRPVGVKGGPSDSLRGWIKVTATEYNFLPDTALFIMQHPKAAPLKLALDTNAIIRVNANSTRVWYRTNTEGGSSGSPCFNSLWELVALHHYGDPDPVRKPLYNEGIPFAAIQKLLEQRGFSSVLG